MDDMRKAFEAHCAGAGLDTGRVMDGPYKRADTQYAWEAWQAATMAERERLYKRARGKLSRIVIQEDRQ